jgi:L,D-transpeptidase YcbB
LSHGCLRVEEPRRTAEVLLAHDKGYTPEKVAELWDSGASVTLSKPIPVYLVYFTARVEDGGQMETYSDIYGNDERVMSALRGRPVRYTAPEAMDPTEAAEPGGYSASNDAAPSNDYYQDAPPPARKNRKNVNASTKKYQTNPIQDALSNIFLN